MKIVTLATGATLSVEPLFTDNDIVFNRFELVEYTGGSLPDINLSVRTTKDCCKLGDILKFKIVNESGWCNEFEAYIYQLSYINTNLTLKLSVCDPEFVRKHYTVTYNGVKEVLNSTYKFSIDSNVDSDLVDNITLYQMDQSNYKFLTNVMNGYRKDIIWGYASGKLMIRDIRNWNSEFSIDAKAGASVIAEQEIQDPAKNDFDIEILEQFTYFTKIKFGKEIVDVSNTYLDLIQNRLHNSKYSNFRSAYNFSMKYIPPIMLCSNVNVVSDETSVENCFVTSRKIEMADTDLHCSYEVKSVNP